MNLCTESRDNKGRNVIIEIMIVEYMHAPPGGGGIGVGVNLTLVYSFVLLQEEQRWWNQRWGWYVVMKGSGTYESPTQFSC